MGCCKQDEESMEIKYLKERIFVANVESVLLYGSEAWILTKCGIRTSVWIGSLDTDQIYEKAVEWLLH